jgi:hypothetical protein
MTARPLEKHSPGKAVWQDLPPIIDESLIHPFKFWDQGIHAGMRYSNELYTLFQSYPIQERLKACAIACEHTEKGINVCITASKTTYSVWLSLRRP